MSSQAYFEPFDPHAATDAQWADYHAVSDIWAREVDPDSPSISHASRMRNMLNMHGFTDVARWLIRDPDDPLEVAGVCKIAAENEKAPSYDSNRHIAIVNVFIMPSLRRRGLGRAATRTLDVQAHTWSRNTLISAACLPAGIAFCEVMGGEHSITTAINRLKLDRVDWNLMQSWRRTPGSVEAGGVQIERFECVPQIDLEAYCALYTETINQQPKGDIALDMAITPDARREQEQRMAAKNITWLTLVSREMDGALSGMTEIFYNPDTPHKIGQDLTGVQSRYRNRGLGKWLKAEMLFEIRERFPQASAIHTGNADNNAPMLAINSRMGFERHLCYEDYTFEIQGAKDIS